MLRFLTAGESHGKALSVIVEGMVANLSLSEEDINPELARRQEGIGRSERMKLEHDKVEIISGVRKGKTLGSPIAMIIKNVDSADRNEAVTKLRPGHADLAGAIKYNQTDVRNILERASARETACRVAAGAIAKKFLYEFNIQIIGRVLEIGGESDQGKWERVVEAARSGGYSLGGIFEIIAHGVPMGLGSHVHYDRRLDAALSSAIMSIPAIKGVEIGLGFEAAKLPGTKVQDEILCVNNSFRHATNNAGGIEGGISNGEQIIIKAAMKPIPTMKKSLKSVDLVSKQPCEAHFERADVCAVHAAAVIGEAMAAIVIANALLEKFGGDSLEEVKSRFM